VCHYAKFHQKLDKSVTKIQRVYDFQDAVLDFSACHKAYLVIFIGVQNLTGINAVILII